MILLPLKHQLQNCPGLGPSCPFCYGLSIPGVSGLRAWHVNHVWSAAGREKDIVLAVGTMGEDDEARPAQVSAEMLGIINMQNI